MRTQSQEDINNGSHINSIPVAQVTSPVVIGVAADGDMDMPAVKKQVGSLDEEEEGDTNDGIHINLIHPMSH